MKTLFVEARSDTDLKPVLDAALKEIKHEKISLLSTVQHVHKLEEAKAYLEKHGKEVYIGKPASFEKACSKQGIYSIHPGQVLGCDASAAKEVIDNVDCSLFIGTGRFHPLKIMLDTDKPVFIANPLTNQVEELDEKHKELYLKKQAIRRAQAKEAKCFGILLSTKPGQMYESAIAKVQEIAKENGKEAIPLVFDTIDPQTLLNFPQIDCYINTACPRIVEDQERYPKTTVNYDEFLEIFK